MTYFKDLLFRVVLDIKLFYYIYAVTGPLLGDLRIAFCMSLQSGLGIWSYRTQR